MSQPSDDLAIPSGQVLSGKFRVERPLGKGGMGAVYVAEHVYTKRRGALKLLHKSYAAVPEIVERFIREASAAGVIGNPHIVETYDAGLLDTGEPYMFMELLDGQPVDQLLDGRGTLRIDEALDITAQAAEGLAAAHGAGIIHRDIKPGNLFLVSGARPFVKLLDFGISKFAPAYSGDHSLTVEGHMLGTPLYMPPEQVVGQKDIDLRADIYSLGVVLYQMLTGRPPFDGETLMELSVRIHEGKFAPIEHLRPDTPPGLDAMLARAMATNRANRYGSAMEFHRELVALIGGQVHSFAATIGVASVGVPGSAAWTAPSAVAASGVPLAASGVPFPGATHPAYVDAATVVPLSGFPDSPVATQTLDAVAATVVPVPSQTAAAALHPERSVAVPPARTSSSRLVLWLGAGAILVGGAAAVWALGGKGSAEDTTEATVSAATSESGEPRPDAVTAVASPASEAATTEAASAAPSVTLEAASTASSTADEKPSNPVPRASASARAPKRGSSRAGQDGLKEDNPFEE